jgi:Ca2+-binding EF-hand superfamily protein
MWHADPSRRRSALDKRIEQTVPGLLETLRKQLAKRGSFGFSGLAKKFHLMDTDKSLSLCREEFSSGMRKVGLSLEPRQIDVLFSYFDEDRSGHVSFEEFLGQIRGEMSKRRVDVVDRMFVQLDLDGDGLLDYQEILQGYDAAQNPSVLDGTLTEGQAKAAFLSALETSAAGTQVNGGVTPSEWRDFFADISASVVSDRSFQSIVQNSWFAHMTKASPSANGPACNKGIEPLKVLVTHANGRESVQEIGDLGFREDDADFNMAVLVYLKKEKGLVATRITVLEPDGSPRKKPTTNRRRNPNPRARERHDEDEDGSEQRRGEIDDMMRRNRTKTPILGYKGHQHERRDRMGTTFSNWQDQRAERDRNRSSAPGGGADEWKSHSQRVHAASPARARGGERHYGKSVRWVGQEEEARGRGESGTEAEMMPWMHSARVPYKRQVRVPASQPH